MRRPISETEEQYQIFYLSIRRIRTDNSEWQRMTHSEEMCSRSRNGERCADLAVSDVSSAWESKLTYKSFQLSSCECKLFAGCALCCDRWFQRRLTASKAQQIRRRLLEQSGVYGQSSEPWNGRAESNLRAVRTPQHSSWTYTKKESRPSFAQFRGMVVSFTSVTTIRLIFWIFCAPQSVDLHGSIFRGLTLGRNKSVCGDCRGDVPPGLEMWTWMSRVELSNIFWCLGGAWPYPKYIFLQTYWLSVVCAFVILLLCGYINMM